MKLLTTARDLKRRKSREKQSLFVAEGIRAVEELVRSALRVRGALVTARLAEGSRGDALLEGLRAAGVEVAEVSESELASAANTESPQGVLALAEVPERSVGSLVVGDRAILLLLDGIQDPGNAGTMVRTAAAFGADATIALPGTVDLWSAKVVRSAMGAQFSQFAVHAEWQQVAQLLERERIELWGAEPTGAPLRQDELVPVRLALAVGNEGAGLSPEVRDAMKRAAGIRTRAQMESLNVAVAAGIILHRLSRV